MGKESLQDFLGAWQVHPLHTFRQGFRRTWIVRASTEPTDKLIAHDFGLAVIKEAVQRRVSSTTERFQAPRADRSVPFVRETETNYPKSWAGIVAAAKSPNDTAFKKAGHDGSVPVSVASLTSVSQAPRAQVAATRIPVEAPASVSAVQPAQQIPIDFANIMLQR